MIYNIYYNTFPKSYNHYIKKKKVEELNKIVSLNHTIITLLKRKVEELNKIVYIKKKVHKIAFYNNHIELIIPINSLNFSNLALGKAFVSRSAACASLLQYETFS